MRITPVTIKSEKEAAELMTALGVSREGVKILASKSVFAAFKIEGIKSWEANIIKQHLLSLGTDAAVERAALIKNIKTAALVFGNLSQLRKLCDKLKGQPFNLSAVAQALAVYLDAGSRRQFILQAGGRIAKIKSPLICGIINVTFDSFSGDGLMKALNSKSKIENLALKKAEKMVRGAARMIDIGGESSRPFSRPVKESEEIKRVIPVLKAVRKEFRKIFISVDTSKYRVAEKAAEEGADIINDITALRAAPRITALIRKQRLGCVLMHMKGRPQNMQVNPSYQDVVAEEIDFFSERIEFCLKKGVHKEQLLIDPGIGFGKRRQDNLKIINELYKFKIFERPLFLGVSRKSFIGEIIKAKAEGRLSGSIAAGVVSLLKGADVLRVHDVKETFQAVKIASAIINN